MPLSIMIRTDFSTSYYRDIFFELLNVDEITKIQIVSGFFSDFVDKISEKNLDLAFSDEVKKKQVYLLGGRESQYQKMIKLKSSFKKKGLNVELYKSPIPGKGDPEVIWHAKIILFHDNDGPVLAIVGSSNFTSPSMFGMSDYEITKPEFVQAEGDSIYWLKSKSEIDGAVHAAFNKWANGIVKPNVYFDKASSDEEFERMLEDLETNLNKSFTKNFV
ncbi:hypothetical protein [Pantoea agglomerans]|jgi:hypothetical protein|uniref:hypothetical protein n=1 Tax=Enterobacter agglomerans TaxID=549 RepID=UPI00320B62D7